MRAKTRKWFNPLFVLTLAVAGLFGVTAAVVNKQVEETPVVEKAEAADTIIANGHGAASSESGVKWEWQSIGTMVLVSGNTYKISAYCWDYAQFYFQVTSTSEYINYSGTEIHYGTNVTAVNNNSGNFQVRLSGTGWYDIYIAYKQNNFKEFYIAAQKSSNKTVKFYKEGGNWSPSKIHYFIRGCSHMDGTVWPGTALSTNYGSTTGLYYCTFNEMFNGYVLTTNTGGDNNQTVDITGGQSGDELFFFDGSKTGTKYQIFNQSQTRPSGYYIFGNESISGTSGAAWNIIGAIAPSSTGGDNQATWDSVSIPAGAEFKIGYYETSGGITFQNAGWGDSKAETHGWFSWDNPKDSHNIVCTADDEYEYKVFLNNSYQTYINRDFTITCYVKYNSNIYSFAEITANSDISLEKTFNSSNLFSVYNVTGYYTNSTCTESITPSTYYPSSDVSIYATVTIKHSVIDKDKVRIWFTYADSKKTGEDYYFDSESATMKVWTHDLQDGKTTEGVTENVYEPSSGGIYENKSNSIRYDYFDIKLSDFTNQYYLTLQRFKSGSYDAATSNSNSHKIRLTSSMASTFIGKVMSIVWDNDEKKWYINSTPVSVSSTDRELATIALCGLKTCTDSTYFNNLNTAFIHDDGVSLSPVFVNDYENGDVTYTGGKTKATNAYIKYQWLRFESGGPTPSAPGLGNFNSLISGSDSGDNGATILIIVASSISILSITALVVLMVKKKKTANK